VSSALATSLLRARFATTSGTTSAASAPPATTSKTTFGR
jgi:hypothetical protein